MQDMSVQGNINTVNVPKPISHSSPCRPVAGDEPVTVAHLRASDNIQRRAADHQAWLQQTAEEDITQDEHFFKMLKPEENVLVAQTIS